MNAKNCHLFWGLLTVILFSNSCISGEAASDAKGNRVQGPHPRMTYTREQLEAIRTSADKASERKRLIQCGEKLLKEPIYIPKEKAGGNWIFYYACPADGSRLRAKSLKEHQCPKCKKVYSDERTVAAYRTLLYNKADRQIFDLANAYAVSGDERFAEPVKKAFLELVALYPTLERHDRWGRKGMFAVVGGRRFCQHLSEAVSIIRLAKAYDLCCQSQVFSDEDRRKIEKEFLEKTVNEINSLKLFVGGKNNHQTWFNAAFVTVGVATGNQTLIDLGYKGKKGLLWQLQNSVTNDGIWYEGTISYHFYALQAIMETLESLKAVGIDLSDNKRLKSLWLGPLNLTYPDGRMPALNDGDPYNLKGQKRAYEFACDYFKDPVFAELAGRKQSGKAVKQQPLKSVDLSDIGIVVLRRGSGQKASTLFFDYGIHGGHHGHPDKLNIILFCLGKELVLDPGRISYSVAEYETWSRTTVAHNTVVIDKRNQVPAKGNLLYFADNPEWSACLGSVSSAYPSSTLKRFLLMTDSFLVDVFWVDKKGSLFGKSEAVWDWIVHCRGDLETNSVVSPTNDVLGKQNGYQHLVNVAAVEPKMPLQFDFVQKDKQVLRLYPVGSKGAFYIGNGIGVRKSEKVPFVLNRRTGKTGETGVFIAVYDFSGDMSAVRDVDLLKVKQGGSDCQEAVGLRVRGKETWLIGLDGRDKASVDLDLCGNVFRRILFEKEK